MFAVRTTTVLSQSYWRTVRVTTTCVLADGPTIGVGVWWTLTDTIDTAHIKGYYFVTDEQQRLSIAQLVERLTVEGYI